jgi:hypothetical protein
VIYDLCTARKLSAPHETSVVVQALKLVLATVIPAAILTTTAAETFVDSPFNFKEL